MIRAACDTLLGLIAVGVMLARTRFRTSGAYWSWRKSTAFGDAPPGGFVERLEALLAYARWVRRMRRMGR